MHSRTSGLSDYLAVDEMDALRIGREHRAPPAMAQGRSRTDRARRSTAVRPVDELLGCASADVRIPFDVREVLARLLDGSRFEEFKPLYGDKLVCGWGRAARLPGRRPRQQRHPVLGGVQEGRAVHPAVQPRDTPLLFVQNITGFMVGSKAEQGGIIRNGAKLINAVSNSTVPHLVLMVGASYGAGNYGMSGRAYDPRFIFTWPNHRIAVMGPKQLSGVMEIVARNAAAGRGIAVDEEALAAQAAMLEGAIEEQSTALCSPPAGCGTTASSTPTTPARCWAWRCRRCTATPVQGSTEYGVWRH